MLEKIGLPTKPSMRGGNWVLDASHCQGCSSQFTFINRKHHCRRCGGLFCNNCTQQRMVLRGQGDAPVRICEPCKKLEEAARFELRYGHRKRTAKANLKQPIKSEDEVLDQILGTGGKHLSEHEPDSDVILDLQRVSSSASCSNVTEERAASGREWNAIKSISVDMDNHGTVDTLQGDPGELRQQAVEEKRKYKILKAEGKSEEALQAFKRGKELERQAAALEIAIRKSRRMAAKSSNLNTVVSDKIDGDEEFSGKEKVTSGRGKEVKNDLAAELRDLGWSDADLHDSDKKKTKLSLEGELSNLLAEVTQKSSHGVKKGSIDKSEVVALKKKALLLKREGKLAEAKEELKRAKILEKQIEEQELLGEAEDSDDELYALINSMNEDKQDELILDDASGPDLKFDTFLIPDDSFTDGKFEVTDDDMHDPELGATLRSFGWSEEDEEQLADQGKQSVDVEALRKQVLGLKREALSQKRAGNVSEAMAILKKAKLLEKDLEGMESSSENFSSEFTQKSSSSTVHVSTLQPIEKENAAETMNSHFTSPPKSKLVIQRELLALKKKALTLRREGRIDEAEEELKKGKVLERQLEEMESAPRKHEEELIKGKILERQQDEMGTNRSKTVHKLGRTNLDSTHLHESGETRSLDFGEDAFETEVTEQDMHDPALLSVLKNLGWNEDVNVESLNMKNTTSKQTKELSAFDSAISVAPRKAKRSKTDIQKELLAIKRKALALRRQGKTEEAEEELEKANALENQIAEMEALSNANFMEVDSSLGSGNLVLPNSSAKNQASGNGQSSAGSLASSFAVNRIPNDEVVALQNVAGVGLAVKDDKMKAPGASSTLPILLLIDSQMSEKSGLLDEGILVGSSFSRQPNQTQKMAELLPSNDAKALHSSINNSVKREVKREETDVNISSISGSSIKPNIHNISKDNESTKASHTKSGYQNFQSKETDASKIDSSLSLEQKLAHGVDALKDEILARKKKAVVLKREGKLAEAREELRQAKLLEKNLDHSPQDIVVKEVASTSTFDNNTSVKQDNKASPPQKPISGRDRFKMQQESLSHKRNALKLRRAGKIDEAEAELELAKSLEKQLEEFDQGSSTNMSGGKSEGMDDVAVEDLLDPQLISALKAIGMDNTAVTSQPQKKTEPEPNFDRRGNHQVEKADLEEQIRTEKLRALNFKREGKQADALEALRSAKRLEKKLASLS